MKCQCGHERSWHRKSQGRCENTETGTRGFHNRPEVSQCECTAYQEKEDTSVTP
jgi:hypothetical protein